MLETGYSFIACSGYLVIFEFTFTFDISVFQVSCKKSTKTILGKCFSITFASSIFFFLATFFGRLFLEFWLPPGKSSHPLPSCLKEVWKKK
jgi:hypothetical protein